MISEQKSSTQNKTEADSDPDERRKRSADADPEDQGEDYSEWEADYFDDSIQSGEFVRVKEKERSVSAS